MFCGGLTLQPSHTSLRKTLGLVVHVFNPDRLEAEAGGSLSLRLASEFYTVSSKKQKKKKENSKADKL